ncbi:MAG TPA: HDIG domain-containing protein [Gemmatimonadales bacterium]|nr:HDIG domain-containing protein [Gemmatimonadales bacterium]
MRDRRLAFPAESSGEPSLGSRVQFHALRWGLLLGVAIVTYLAFPAPRSQDNPVLAVGEIAPETIRAPIPFLVPKKEDEIAREREALARTAQPVYRFSSAAYDSALGSVRIFFDALMTGGIAGPAGVRAAAARAQVRLGNSEAAFLADSTRRREMGDVLADFLGSNLARGVADASVIRGEPSRRITLHRGDSDTVVLRDSVLTFADLMDRAERASLRWRTPDAQRVFRLLVADFYQPTILLDETLTESRREQLRQSIDTVKYVVRAGEPIVGAHELVSQEAHDKLLALRDQLRQQETDQVLARSTLGAILYDFLVLSTFWLIMLLYRQETYREIREVLFIALLFSGIVLLTAAITRLFPDRPELVPIPLAAMLMTMVYNGRQAVLVVFALVVLLGGQWALHENYALFFGLVGGVAAAVGMRAVRRRQSLYATILVVLLAYAVAAVTLGLMLGWNLSEVTASTLAGAVTTLGSAALAMLILPLAESLTRITTNLTLLELSDFRRPLLRRLALEAPGTWAHSISMANLCEAACNAIGANGLLARVGCYYHDIGKLKRPEYFVENQTRGHNPHDKLKPQQSAQIIRNHVRDGIELAEEAHLPPAVRAFIPEHHGTTDIKFFLHRARGRAPDHTVDLEEFRYPGPRPQSAETAIAMLADSTEAAVRVLDDPTPEALRAAIEQLVNQKLAAGQLDDAPLTLRDLDRVKNEFSRVMSGIHHNRIEYPRASGGITAQPESAPAE